MEDGISGRLQHRHITCCEKGGRRGRRACRVQRWHHHGDVVFQTGGLVYNTQLDHLVQKFVCLLAINFRIHYLRNFIFEFPVNYDWNRGQLYSLRESVEHSGFEHEHIKDQVNRVYRFWKVEDKQQYTRLSNDFIGSKIFFGEFL